LEVKANEGLLNCENFEEITARKLVLKKNVETIGYGRELFAKFRCNVSASEDGASVLF